MVPGRKEAILDSNVSGWRGIDEEAIFAGSVGSGWYL